MRVFTFQFHLADHLMQKSSSWSNLLVILLSLSRKYISIFYPTEGDSICFLAEGQIGLSLFCCFSRDHLLSRNKVYPYLHVIFFPSPVVIHACWRFNYFEFSSAAFRCEVKACRNDGFHKSTLELDTHYWCHSKSPSPIFEFFFSLLSWVSK